MKIKRAFFLTIGSVFIAVALSIVIVIGITLFEWQPRTCLTGKMLLHREGNLIDLGEMEFCGKDLSVSGLYGPSLEAHIFLLKRQNRELIDELNECTSKIQL